MLVPLRRVGKSSSIATTLLQRRGNATLQSSSADQGVTPSPLLLASTRGGEQTKTETKTKTETEKNDADGENATGAQTQGRHRRRKTPIPPRRPPITVGTPRKWNRPLAEGVLPAYDLALKVIRTDSVRLKAEARTVRALVKELEAKVGERVGEVQKEEVEEARKKLRILEVQSEVNLPEVRWRVANAMVDMKKPVHRHLMEQKWRGEGGLDLLMERIHQMKVVPDVLPDLHPSLDVHLAVRSTPLDFKTTKKRTVGVEPGTFLVPEQTMQPPSLYVNVFHTDTRLYTLLLVDPDVPNEEEESFKTFLHWLKPNIPLSATHRTRIPNLNDHTPYIPPHPQRGTPYHRYVLLLLPQAPLGAAEYTLSSEARAAPGVSTSVHLEIPPIEDAARRDFDVRAFMQRWGLNGAKGGGAHMWREVWNEKVSEIYTNVLKEPEPRYGRPPKADPYAELKQSKRYV